MNGMTQKELEQEKLTVERMCLELKAKRQVSHVEACFLQEPSKHPHQHVLLLCSTRPGCGGAAIRAPDRRPDPHLRPHLRGAARVEAAAADCLHWRSAQCLRGPAAELVSHHPAWSPPPPPLPPPASSPTSSHLLALSSSPPPAAGSPQWPRACSRSAST